MSESILLNTMSMQQSANNNQKCHSIIQCYKIVRILLFENKKPFSKNVIHFMEFGMVKWLNH